MVRIICILVLVVYFSGCDALNNTRSLHITKGSSLNTTIPASLRAIGRDQLTLELSIDGESSRYDGRDFPDGPLLIELELQPDTTYTIDIKWFALEHLLLHEYGEFFTDSISPEIALDIEFADEGTGSFDDDCDGISNLEELMIGTDPGLAGSGVCPSDDSLLHPNLVYLVRNYLSFLDSGYRDTVTSLEQSINVREADLSRSMWFWINVLNNEPFATATDVRMSLVYSDEFQKHVYFEINKNTVNSFQELTSTCGPIGTIGHFCRLPFKWETDRWYTLKLELVDVDVWQASIYDQYNDQSTVIGRIEVMPDLVWNKPRFGLSFSASIESVADCNESLPRVAMQAKSAIANGVASVKKSGITVSKCVDAGLGWRAGTKTEGESDTYNLSIGDGR